MSEWVNCPICGDCDMEKTTNADGDSLIHCTNHACKSNGGDYSLAADHIDEAHKLLKECQWTEEQGTTYCPICRNVEEEGHKPTCRLKLFLEANK